MTKIFRKIRYDLMNQNKTTRYFKYAIGEIILVVIGILIALQINNWNENRKDKVLEQDFYCKLLEDFELDIENINKLKAEAQYKIEKSKQLLLDLQEKNKSIDYLINTYIQALRTNAFSPSKVAIQDITSSGKLNLLKNETLKQNLLRYYSELDNLLFQLELNRNKSLERAFGYESDIALGFQHADYVTQALGPEVFDTLPEVAWHLDSTSPIFRQFQNDLVIFVTMSDREKQHFASILSEMQPVYSQLKDLCR